MQWRLRCHSSAVPVIWYRCSLHQMHWLLSKFDATISWYFDNLRNFSGNFNFDIYLWEAKMINENPVQRQGHSSLPLQALIYLNWHFTAFFFLLNICLYTFKGSYLPNLCNKLNWINRMDKDLRGWSSVKQRI